MNRLPPWAPGTAVLLVAAAGMVRVLMENWREGAVLIGGALLLAAVLRVLVPPEQAGLLVVRGRALDVLCYAVLGGAMVALAVGITRNPPVLT